MSCGAKIIDFREKECRAVQKSLISERKSETITRLSNLIYLVNTLEWYASRRRVPLALFVDKANNACKKEPRRGDGAQAGVKPLLSIRKKEKPQRGDGTAACPLSFRHSSGVFMGGRFHAGVTLSLTPACSPSLLRSFLGQPLQGKTSERRWSTGRGEAPVKHTQKEKAPKGRWNGSMSVIVPSLLRSFDGGCFMQGLRYRFTTCLYSVALTALYSAVICRPFGAIG